MHFLASLLTVVSALNLANASILSLRLKQRDNTSIAVALAGASKLNNAVAFSICDVSYQSFAAVAAINPGSINTYVLTADCQALGYLVASPTTSSTSIPSSSISFSLNTVSLVGTSTSTSTSSASAAPSIAPLVVGGTYHGNLPICTGGFIRDPSGGGGCVQCVDQTC